MTGGAGYRFVPSVRAGFQPDATFVEDAEGAAHLSAEVTFGVELTVEGNRPDEGWEAASETPTKRIRMYGPGDVAGLDRRQVVRVEPEPGTANFPPNYFPAVEFDRPDLPWLFSPERADAHGRIHPWLRLVVVDAANPSVTLDDGGGDGSGDGTGSRAVLEAPVEELPPAGEAWAWAHAQVVGGGKLDDVLAGDSTRTLSRLVCPRNLAPSASYIAAVVPTFETGRLSGLGFDPAEAASALAWGDAATDPVQLPVYYHWAFETGDAGDFEQLVTALEPRDLPAHVGLRSVDVSRPGPDSLEPTGTDAATVEMTGALAAPESQTRPEGEVLDGYSQRQREELTRLLNRPERLTSGTTAAGTPVVGPPIYGQWHANASRVDSSVAWLSALNVEPRYRIAAGLGAAVVRDHQESLVAAAWNQAGAVRETNDVLRRGQLGREASDRIHGRLATLAPERLLQVTQPMHAQVRPYTFAAGEPSSRTFAAHVDDAAGFAPSVLTPAFRRLVRPKGTLMAGTDLLATPATFAADFLEGTTVVGDLVENLDDRLLSLDTIAGTVSTDQPVTDGGEATIEGFDALVTELDPSFTVPAAVLSQVGVGDALRERPDPLQPVRWAPRFPQPLSRELAALSEEYLLPGIGDVPPDTVGALATSPAFVEAFLAGANHEMASELLWRRFPTDRRGTYFRTFWNRVGDPTTTEGTDIEPMTKWGDRALGNGSGDASTVLVVRGELLRRYPETVVYAVKARGTPDARTPAVSELHHVTREGDTDHVEFPRFRGRLPPDVTFLGFDLSPAEATGAEPSPSVDGDGEDSLGWFLVVEEPMGETRFGLDADPDSAHVGSVPPGVTTDGDDPVSPAPDAVDTGWDALSWGHVTPTGSVPADVRHLHVRGGRPDADRWRVTATDDETAEWGHNSAHMARIIWQRPVRVCIHADDLLTTEET